MKLLAIALFLLGCGFAGADLPLVVTTAGEGFPLVQRGKPAAVWVDPAASDGLRRVADWFAEDLRKLSGTDPSVSTDKQPPASVCVLVGVLGAGGVLDGLVEAGKIDVAAVEGRVEASVTLEVANPLPGVERALVVAGSDKRGAIYGLFDLSRAAGVSPWCWWADVPIPPQSELRVASGAFVRSEPRVRYRGIFLNDEAPALANWAQEKFGGCNSKMYVHVFELILRNRGNFLWPAMWGRSLFDDDPESQRLADELGVVIGTSHHEPMVRAHVEWERFGKGPWDYSKNAETLRAFWREGIQRMGRCESVVTLGMRGDGDMPMTEDANIDLLQRIVSDQRTILGEELGDAAASQPQVWALYKEVQEYYDRGMRAPDDVILLLCDDNWGNIRRLPRPDQPKHPGGYGVYYHFDYVGDPRNYKWINTNPLPRVWEQMHLAWQHGVEKIWVVNVGDLKPMEQPIDFFLTMAYDPEAFPAETHGERLAQWQHAWAAEQIGERHAQEAAELIAAYTKLNSRRKPELLDAGTYSLKHFDEWPRVVEQWRRLAARAQALEAKIPESYRSTYYQLVLHPVLACCNLNELYYAVALNHDFAAKNDLRANAFADKVERYFARDGELTERYHKLNGGKWNHQMSQTHIGYTSWQQPDIQVVPEVRRVGLTQLAPEQAEPVPPAPAAFPDDVEGYVESQGAVSIDATSFCRATEAAGIKWLVLPDHGRTGSAVTTIPVTAPATPAGDGPRLEYRIYLTAHGPVTIDAYLSPTQDFYGADVDGEDLGIRFAVSIDDGPAQVVDMHADRSTPESNPNSWRGRVAANIHSASTEPIEVESGAHTLKFWRIDSGLVLQKLVVKRAGAASGYLGPPQSELAPGELAQ